MVEVAGRVSKNFLGTMHTSAHVGQSKWMRAGLVCQDMIKFKSQPGIRVKSQMVNHPPSTYSSRISTDIPLYETPGASFDLYLEDKPRVFRAIFPDKRRSQQINEVKPIDCRDWQNAANHTLKDKRSGCDIILDEWRVHMLPIQFLFLSVLPVIDMRLRCKTNGKEYPPGVPPAISKVLELDIVRWELQGLDTMSMPTHFSLGVKGALYPDRRGVRSRLKGQLEMKISVVLPAMLALVPEDVLRSVSEAVLTRLVENMKDKVNSSLLADYSDFRREQQMNPVKRIETRRDQVV